MTTAHRRSTGFTLIELLVVVAIIALLVSILLPSLGKAKDLAMTIVCSSRHNGGYKGFSYYADQFNGVWIAPWHQGNPDGDSIDWDQQWPYTMNVYAAGFSIPDGEDIYSNGGWWTPYGRGGQGGVPRAKQLQCAVMESRPKTNPWWKPWTTMSYCVMGGHRNRTTGVWQYTISDYPKPELMTHASSTCLLMCQAGVASESGTNAWVGYSSFYAIDPHMGESNVTFCDGHTQTLGHMDLYETMWQSMWERGDQVSHTALPN